MNTKSANFLHILPFAFLYILHEHIPDRKELICNDDRIYKYIPNYSKNKFWTDKIKYVLMSIPIIILLLKSQSEAIEHTLVITSYAIAIKSMMHFLTPCIPKEEFTNIIVLCSLLNLIYFQVIPKDKMTEAYVATMLYSVYLIAGRYTTSANIITDFSLVHLVFMYTKMF